MRNLKERNRYFPGLVSFTSGSVTPIFLDRHARAHGKSRVGAFGLIQLALTAFVSFSSSPVRFVSIMGLIASMGAAAFGAFIVGIKIFSDRAIPGWASIMTVTAFTSGIQLLCIGIIGEYIARIYDEVKQRPLFIVDKILDKRINRQKDAA